MLKLNAYGNTAFNDAQVSVLRTEEEASARLCRTPNCVHDVDQWMADAVDGGLENYCGDLSVEVVEAASPDDREETARLLGV